MRCRSRAWRSGDSEAALGVAGVGVAAPGVAGRTGPGEAQQASLRPREAEILEGLPVWVEEPQGA
jgi:hypothetical protein